MLSFITLLATTSPDFYLAGLAAGFLIGALGHLVKAPMMIVAGIGLLSVTAAVFVLSTS